MRGAGHWIHTPGGMYPGRVKLRLAAAAALLATAATLSACTSPTSAPSAASGQAAVSENLDAAAFAALVERPGTVILDVRTPSEFAAGHLANALNIDVEASDFGSKISSLDKAKTYAIYCRSGNRSAVALKSMKSAGFTDVHHLVGGIGAWQRAGYKIVT